MPALSLCQRTSRNSARHLPNVRFDYKLGATYGVKLPYTFLDLKSWHGMIMRHRLRISRFSKFRFHPLAPCKHVLFELHK